jgi:hypothetical protein
MKLLVDDWQAQIAEEQKQRSAALLAAAMGSDYRAVDDCLYLCDALIEIRKLAVLLADRTGQTATSSDSSSDSSSGGR